MFCPQCGKQLPDNAKFCSGCGHSFAQFQQQAQPAAPQQATGQQTPYQQPAASGPQFGGGPVQQGFGPAGGAQGKVGSKLGSFASGKKVIIGAAVVVVIVLLLLVRLCSGGGGSRFYKVSSFLNSSSSSIASELGDHQGLRYKDSNSGWSGRPDDCPIGGSVTVSLVDPDGDYLSEEDLEDGAEVAGMTAIWIDAKIESDDDDPDELLDVLERECSLGSELDRGEMHGAASYAVGKCKVNGQDGFWMAAVVPMEEDDGEVECYVVLAAGTLEAVDADDYDDLLDMVDEFSF